MSKSFLLLLALPLTTSFAAEPALTIYNQNFAVVRDTVPLDLKAGSNDVRFTETTTHLEPDSVILRDPAGKVAFQVLEQNYRADPVSQALLLSLFEGKTIGFLVDRPNAAPEVVQGKIVRSGYVIHSAGLRQFGSQYYQQQQFYASGGTGMDEPIIEVDGKLRFTLPGQPLFPALGDDTILKPTLDWKIQSGEAAKVEAELAYVTGGMTWAADYSVVAPEQGDQIDLVGLVTMDNQSGKTLYRRQDQAHGGRREQGPARERHHECTLLCGWRNDYRLSPGSARRDRENLRRVSPLQPAPAHHPARP